MTRLFCWAMADEQKSTYSWLNILCFLALFSSKFYDIVWQKQKMWKPQQLRWTSTLANQQTARLCIKSAEHENTSCALVLKWMIDRKRRLVAILDHSISCLSLGVSQGGEARWVDLTGQNVQRGGTPIQLQGGMQTQLLMVADHIPLRAGRGQKRRNSGQ